MESFSYTSRADLIFIWGVSLTHPVLASSFFIWGASLSHSMLALFFCVKFLFHIPCWLNFYPGSFSYTSQAGFNFISGLSLTYPCWLNFYQGSFSYTSRAGFMFMQGVSLTYPMLTPKEELVFFLFDFSVAFQTVLCLVFDVSEEQKLCQD